MNASFDDMTLILAAPLALSYVAMALDDVFVDLTAAARKLGPEELTPVRLSEISRKREGRIAILVAAWKEAGVLENMVVGNLKTIRYSNYDIFLGVYPNDPETRSEAEALAAAHPNVHVVLNSLPGPTSKGQVLNEAARAILAYEKRSSVRYDGFVIHDSEDVIHSLSLKIINHELDRNDLVQLPVLSLPVPGTALVAGTYVDEFSEGHTKDMIVRSSLGAPIPSAGVGVALSRRLVLSRVEREGGYLLNERSVTEDYELGISAGRSGFTSKFACYSIAGQIVATREYFPKRFRAAVRQKSRWVLGIAFQGTENLGWRGSLINALFLYRDRKGPFSHLLVAAGGLVSAYILFRIFQDPDFADRLNLIPSLALLFAINAVLMLNRILQRVFGTAGIYGWRAALWVPVRVPVANLVNALASMMATFNYLRSKMSGTAPKWAKTEHELPFASEAEAG